MFAQATSNPVTTGHSLYSDALANYSAVPSASDLFSSAPPPTSDLFTSASPDVRAKWHALANGLAAQCGGQFGQLYEQLGQQIQDLGISFRQIGDKDERPWPLSPLPLLIGSEEWGKIEQGLIQRADLLERVLADVYGEQRLVTEGHLPATVITGSEHFQRKMIGVKPPKGHYIHLYAVDLARGPSGEWRVLSDRLRLPTGMGYALENRLALSRSTGSLMSELNVRRMASFFGQFRRGISSDCLRSDPRVALLTPGRYNQSYHEQAHLARYLGLLLVEGRDLVVDDHRLYVRTIEGLKRIDAIWRWLDSSMIDPLAFDSHSRIGVADLFEAWSAGGLVVANWPGVGVVESGAFSAFMPRLARKLLGQPLTLPNVATWWCGQPNEYETVRNRFDELVISSSFSASVEGLADGRTRAGVSFGPEEREKLLATMALRPMDYAGQEIVHLSTTPALIDSVFEPRPFTLRAFVARGPDGQWVVMPGGFARLSKQGDLRTSLMGAGDVSADVCIVDDVPALHRSLLNNDTPTEIRRAGGILPSQAADNHYWFARYCERTEMTVRIIRTLLGSSIEADGGGARAAQTMKLLVSLLVTWGVIDEEDADQPLQEICSLALYDEQQNGSVTSLISRGRDIGRSLRDRMSVDFWRIANLTMPPKRNKMVEAMFKTSNLVIDRLSSLAGLSGENMSRNAAWRFYDLGHRIERAINMCRLARLLGTHGSSNDNLNALLELSDSQITYRTHYFVGPVQAPVIDLVMLAPQNPRSFMFQLEQINTHLAFLPSLQSDGLAEMQLRLAKGLYARAESIQAADLTIELLQEFETRLLAISEAISQRYFLQFEKLSVSSAAPYLS